MRNQMCENMAKAAMEIDNYFTEGQISSFVQFDQLWGSTALGFGGVGGSMMTPAVTTVVFRAAGGAVVFFNGRRAYSVRNPNNLFYKDMNTRFMKPVSDKEQYEKEKEATEEEQS